MRWLIFVSLLLSLGKIATGQMVRNDNIGNDRAKEQLCALRASAPGNSKPVPFEIDSQYVSQSRGKHPDITFIALDGVGPTLVECYVRADTGRYEPAAYEAEGAIWHLIKPKQFGPKIGTRDGNAMAANVCFKAATARVNRPNFDHSVYSELVEVHTGSYVYHPGDRIAGERAEDYDIVVKGKAFYGPANPDLSATNFICLLSPMLELKAIRIK